MKKIAVLSDIHGNILALEKVVEDFEQRNIDLVVNLGDHLSGPLWPKETIEFLKRKNWIQIRGNHERQLISQHPEEFGLSDLHAYQQLNDNDLDCLRSLRPTAQIGKEISIFHGAPRSDLTYLLETIKNGRNRLATRDEIKKRLNGTLSPVMLCGHSHIPRVIKAKKDQLFVNPGSVGLPAYDDINPEPHVMETGSPHARYAIIEKINNEWYAELIAVSYDHQKAAEQASKNNRPDWEIALQTGYMK